MADPYSKPYLDASVFIAWVKNEITPDGVERGRIAAHVLHLAQRGTFRISTSTLTLAEVHKRHGNPEHLSDTENGSILAFFEQECFELVNLDRGIGEEANRLCRRLGLHPADAVHLASALRAQCDVLLSWDGHLTRLNLPDIRTEEPEIVGQMELPIPMPGP